MLISFPRISDYLAIADQTLDIYIFQQYVLQPANQVAIKYPYKPRKRLSCNSPTREGIENCLSCLVAVKEVKV